VLCYDYMEVSPFLQEQTAAPYLRTLSDAFARQLTPPKEPLRRAQYLGGHYLLYKHASRAPRATLYGEQTLLLAYEPHGKPYFPRLPQFAFNITHSQNLVLLAFALSDPPLRIGADMEAADAVDLPKAKKLAARFFSAGEQARLATVPDAAYVETFLRLWTQKEACLKCSGQGLRALPHTEGKSDLSLTLEDACKRRYYVSICKG